MKIIDTTFQDNNIEHLSFIKEIVTCAQDFIQDEIFNKLCKKIPIFLITEEKMKIFDQIYNKKLKGIYNEIFLIIGEHEYSIMMSNFKNPGFELFGYYTRKNNDLFTDTPIIAICLERIADTEKNKEKFLFLLTKIILHELSHAYMDAENENKNYGQKDLFFHFMEESMANLMILEIIDYIENNCICNSSISKQFYQYAKNFVKKQPLEYALGGILFEHKQDIFCNLKGWKIWKKFKLEYQILSKQKSRHDIEKRKKIWLRYILSNYEGYNINNFKNLYYKIFDDIKGLSFDFEVCQKQLEMESLQDLSKRMQQGYMPTNSYELRLLIIKYIKENNLKAIENINVRNINSFHDKDIDKGIFENIDIKNKTLNLSKWDTSQVMNLKACFCNFKGGIIGLNKWDISKVKDFRWCFYSKDLSKKEKEEICTWKISENVDTSEMFGKGKDWKWFKENVCSLFKDLHGKFNKDKVINHIKQRLKSLEEL